MQAYFQSSESVAQAVTSFPHEAGVLSEAQVVYLGELARYADQWFNFGTRKLNRDNAPKMPINPATGGNAKVDDPTTAGTFDQAVAQVGPRGFGRGGGVGVLMTTAAANFVGLDFDDVRNPDSGELNEMGAEVVERFAKTYVEVSPSGKGLRVFCSGAISAGKVTVKGGSVEVYPAGAKRFLRVTGAVVEGCAGVVTECQDGLDWLAQVLGGLKGVRSTQTPDSVSGGMVDGGAVVGPVAVAGGISSNDGGVAGAGGGVAVTTSASISPMDQIDQWFAALRERRPAMDPAEVLAGMQARAAEKPTGQLAKAMKGDTGPWSKDASQMDFFLSCEAIRRGCDSVEDVDTVLMATGAKRAKWAEKRGGFGDLFTQTVHSALKSVVNKAPRLIKATSPHPKPETVGRIRGLQAAGGHVSQTAGGKLKPTLHTMVTILRNAAPGLFAYDEFRATTFRTRSLAELEPYGNEVPGPVVDDDYRRVTLYLEREFELAATVKDVREAVLTVAKDFRHNPIGTSLQQLEAEWLKAGRPKVLDTWLTKYMMVDDTGIEDYVRKVGRASVMQTVRRVLAPGAEVHSMPVFIGNGGNDKGKMLKALAGAVGENLFTDNRFDLRNSKDVVEKLARFLIVEWGEYGPQTDQSAFKAAMTQQGDTHRKAYDFESEDFPRQFTLWGTSNQREFISDPTDGEARRLWPLHLKYQAAADVEGFKQAARLMWGEATWHAKNTDERHYIDRRDAAEFAQWNEVIRVCRIPDPIEDALDAFLTDWAMADGWLSRIVTTNDVAKAIDQVDPYTTKPKRGDFIRVNALMTARGMIKTQNEAKAKAWRMPPDVKRRLLGEPEGESGGGLRVKKSG